MFTRGTHEGKRIDNTTDEEIKALINAYKEINPVQIMIYSIDRKTPAEALEKVSKAELDRIGERIESETGIPVSVA